MGLNLPEQLGLQAGSGNQSGRHQGVQAAAEVDTIEEEQPKWTHAVVEPDT